MKATSYEVIIDQNNSFHSANARSVASVAVSWKKSGHDPYLCRITDDPDKGIVINDIDITTVAATARALAGK